MATLTDGGRLVRLAGGQHNPEGALFIQPPDERESPRVVLCSRCRARATRVSEDGEVLCGGCKAKGEPAKGWLTA